MKTTYFKLRSFSFIIATLITLSFASCKKEKVVGPTGPAGPAGSVNTVNSDWLDVDLQSGIYAFTTYASIDAPELTQDILDKGVIKVYVGTSSNVWEIPNKAFDGLYVVFSVGKIEIYSPTEWDTYSGYRYRYVLIPAK